jgi:adenine phosphoribosyltransferase
MEKFTNKFKEPYSKELIKNQLRDVIDFPKPGILFKDIAPLLKDPKSIRFIINDVVNHIRMDNIDIVLGLDARGFILGPMIADKLDVGFGMIRKAGKLPPPYIQREYDLEYGKSKIAISPDVITEGMNVHLHDDLLATSGSLRAAIHLIEELGGIIASISVVVELSSLGGREKLKEYKLYSFLQV